MFYAMANLNRQKVSACRLDKILAEIQHILGIEVKIDE